MWGVHQTRLLMFLFASRETLESALTNSFVDRPVVDPLLVFLYIKYIEK